MNQKSTIEELYKLFTQVNADCEKKGDLVVPLSDAEYYSQQIYNLYEDNMSWDEACSLADDLAEHAKTVNP